MSLPDPTDWLPTPLSALAPLDAGLRCQVCKDFFTTPMITSCSHTFCSLCIRRCLSQDGRCPACREQDQEMKLRRNWVAEELVASFTQSRAGLLRFAEEAAPKEELESYRPNKRRKTNGEGTTQLVERMSTRSQSRQEATQASQGSVRSLPIEVIEDSEGESSSKYEDQQQPARPPRRAEPDDGLVACPACGKRMKEQSVYVHLDTCTGSSSDAASSPVNHADPQTLGSIAYTLSHATKQKERLPTINYALLSENQLRKKMKDLGIPSLGPKPLLQRRHTEWLNLWNANCDSREPRGKNKLLSELDTWERTQGRQIANNSGPSGVMVKDFDRDAYARSNRSDFDDLIRKAREKKNAAKSVDLSKTPNGDSGRTPMPLEEIFAANTFDGVAEENEPLVPGSPNLDPTQSQSSRLNDIVV